MNNGRRLLKFKYGTGEDSEFKKCLVKFETSRADGDYDIFTFECDDDPSPDLKKRLDAMAEFLLENCEIEKNEIAHKVQVKSVTCTHKEMEGFDVHGLVISGTRELKNCNAPMCLNSPHKTDVPYCEDSDDESILLSPECLHALDALVSEVFSYVDGKRAQLELDLEEPETMRSVADRVVSQMNTETKETA